MFLLRRVQPSFCWLSTGFSLVGSGSNGGRAWRIVADDVDDCGFIGGVSIELAAIGVAVSVRRPVDDFLPALRVAILRLFRSIGPPKKKTLWNTTSPTKKNTQQPSLVPHKTQEKPVLLGLTQKKTSFKKVKPIKTQPKPAKTRQNPVKLGKTQ